MLNLMRTLTTSYIVLFSINLLAMAITTGLANVDTQWAKVTRMICNIAMIWSTGMLALITTLAKREIKGEPLIPINGGNTEMIRKTDLTQTETVTQTKSDK